MRWILPAVLALCMVLAGMAGAEATPAPKIAFDESKYAFSPVVEGETVAHEFVVRNLGDAELEIFKVRTG